jgi:hypothetical protein
MHRWPKTLVLFATPALFWSLSSANALAAQSWGCSGRVIRGAGQGATVPTLQLETQGNTVRFLSGPDAGQQIALDGERSAKTATGTWQFLPPAQKLEATFYQDDPYRVISYRCEPQ